MRAESTQSCVAPQDVGAWRRSQLRTPAGARRTGEAAPRCHTHRFDGATRPSRRRCQHPSRPHQPSWRSGRVSSLLRASTGPCAALALALAASGHRRLQPPRSAHRAGLNCDRVVTLATRAEAVHALLASSLSALPPRMLRIGGLLLTSPSAGSSRSAGAPLVFATFDCSVPAIGRVIATMIACPSCAKAR